MEGPASTTTLCVTRMHAENQFETIDACRFCFMCRHVCTTGLATGWESDTPRGRALVLFKTLRGHAQYSPDLVEAVYRCCLCGVCQSWCKGGYTPPAAILAARRDIVELGFEPEGARLIRRNILEEGNPFGLPAAERFKNLEFQRRSGVQTEVQQAPEVLYYVGCHTAWQRPEIANAFLHILEHCGIDFTLLEDETSTGKPLSVLGYDADAKQTAETLATKIKSTGCRLVVTTCPSSFDALKNDYPAMKVDLGGVEVLHAAQYLDRLVSRGRLVPHKRLDRTVTVLDSDRLGRFNNIYDEPRRLLEATAGMKLVEMSWTRQLAHSCAETAGVMPLLNPDLDRPLVDRILSEASRTGAQCLATCCPVTKQALSAANPQHLEIRDVIEFLADALP